jgi:hypothetical protein
MRRWTLQVCAVLSACASACTTSGSVTGTLPDASTDVAAPSPDASSSGDASMPVDGNALPPDDTGAPIDAGYDAPPDANACPSWDGGYESPACSTCLREMCCDSVTACESDPDCVALDQCVDACIATGGEDDAGPDAASVSTCAQNCSDSRAPAARAEWQALNHCLVFDCYNKGAGPCL